jgi:hypothetical protein
MGKMMFGADEKLECLVDVELKGKDGEALCLAHKFTKVFFVAGIYLSDDGYVLKIRDREAYYPLPDDAELSAMQAEQLLPKPFPAYDISIVEYAFGYSLWLILAGTALYYGVKALIVRRRGQLELPAQPL